MHGKDRACNGEPGDDAEDSVRPAEAGPCGERDVGEGEANVLPQQPGSGVQAAVRSGAGGKGVTAADTHKKTRHRLKKEKQMLGSVSPYAAKSRLYVACRWQCTVQRRPAGGWEGATLQPAQCWWVQGGADGLLKFSSCDCPDSSLASIDIGKFFVYS